MQIKNCFVLISTKQEYKKYLTLTKITSSTAENVDIYFKSGQFIYAFVDSVGKLKPIVWHSATAVKSISLEEYLLIRNLE